MNKFTYNLVSFLSYSLLISFSLCLFWLFRPFTYLDNFRSQVFCLNNNSLLQAGPNFVFSLEEKLDEFNDIKARKLCHYSAIFDYGNTLKTPEKNYRFIPSFDQDSSWLQAGFLALLPFFLVIHLSWGRKKNFLAAICLGLLLFLLWFKQPINQLFCQRQIAVKTYDVIKSVGKGGRIINEIETDHLKKTVKILYQGCIHKNSKL